jgi:hypothetical protein
MRTSPFWRLGLTLIVILAGCRPEKTLESGRRYLSTSYNDSTFETFDRTTRAVTGVVVAKSGESVRFRIRTGSHAQVNGVDLTLHPASRRNEPLIVQRVGMPKGTLPLMGNSVAFLEQLLRRAKDLGGDSLTLSVMQVGANPDRMALTLVRRGVDSVLLLGPDLDQRNALHAAVDTAGRILGGVIPLSGTRIMVR